MKIPTNKSIVDWLLLHKQYSWLAGVIVMVLGIGGLLWPTSSLLVTFSGFSLITAGLIILAVSVGEAMSE